MCGWSRRRTVIPRTRATSCVRWRARRQRAWDRTLPGAAVPSRCARRWAPLSSVTAAASRPARVDTLVTEGGAVREAYRPAGEPAAEGERPGSAVGGGRLQRAAAAVARRRRAIRGPCGCVVPGGNRGRSGRLVYGGRPERDSRACLHRCGRAGARRGIGRLESRARVDGVVPHGAVDGARSGRRRRGHRNGRTLAPVERRLPFGRSRRTRTTVSSGWRMGKDNGNGGSGVSISMRAPVTGGALARESGRCLGRRRTGRADLRLRASRHGRDATVVRGRKCAWSTPPGWWADDCRDRLGRSP